MRAVEKNALRPWSFWQPPMQCHALKLLAQMLSLGCQPSGRDALHQIEAKLHNLQCLHKLMPKGTCRTSAVPQS